MQAARNFIAFYIYPLYTKVLFGSLCKGNMYPNVIII